MTKPQNHPTHEDKEAEIADKFWDSITKIILLCPYCAAQPSSWKDLVEHAKAVHGVEPVKVEVANGD